jgi:hypothetical protein
MAALMPVLRQRFFDLNGKPLSGGKLFSYLAGTTIPAATYTDVGGLTANPNPMILDAAGEANIWLRPGNFKFVLTDSLDVVQFTIDGVKPNDGGGGGILDGDYTYTGFSARFNEAFTSTGLNDTLTKILNITYLPPLISMSASGSGTVREKGAAVTSTTLTANVTKRSDPLDRVQFFLNPSTLLDTQTSGGAIPSGGASTYAWTGSITDNATFRAEARDNGASGGPTVVSTTVNFTFVYPYYFGAGAVGITAAAVGGLTKDIRTSTATLAKSFTATAGQVFYFAYPASYGALTSILDVNNFETIGDWTLRTQNITGLDATAQSYRIYEFNNPVVAGTYDYTFKR